MFVVRIAIVQSSQIGAMLPSHMDSWATAPVAKTSTPVEMDCVKCIIAIFVVAMLLIGWEVAGAVKNDAGG